MENPEIQNVVDAETGHGNFGSGQIRSGSANKNPFEPRNASNIGSINPNPTLLSIFPQAKRGLVMPREISEEEIRVHRQQLNPQQQTAFNSARIIAAELWPKTKRKIVQYPPNKQQQPITLQPKPVQVVGIQSRKY